MRKPADGGHTEAGDLHSRLLAHDPTAPVDLFERYLVAIAERLARSFPNLDEHLIQDATTDALFNYAEHPERYDPARSPLASYLYMSTRGDLLNRLEREKRHRQRLVPLDDVELAPRPRNMEVTRAHARYAMPGEEESLEGLRSAADAACRTERERQVLQLLIEGERRTEAFAQVLGITAAEITEQRREVKRVKERLLKRLRRILIASPQQGPR